MEFDWSSMHECAAAVEEFCPVAVSYTFHTNSTHCMFLYVFLAVQQEPNAG